MINKIQYKIMISVAIILAIMISVTGIKWFNSNQSHANKNIDNILKLDTNNIDEKKLRDDKTNFVEKQKDEIAVNSTLSTTGVIQINNHGEQEYTPEMAVQLAINKVAQALNLKDTSDIIGYCKGFFYKDGKNYAYVRLKSKSMMQVGGTGTIANMYIAKDGSTIGF